MSEQRYDTGTFSGIVHQNVKKILKDHNKSARIEAKHSYERSAITFSGDINGATALIGQAIYSICKKTGYSPDLMAASAWEYALWLKKAEDNGKIYEKDRTGSIKKKPLPVKDEPGIDSSLWE